MTELPDDVVREAERLTRLARNAIDDGERAAYERRRNELLADRGFAARIREEDDTLVLYPREWLDEEGSVRVARIDDTDRAAELSLSGPGDADEYEDVAEHNADLVRAVEEEHGPVHAANVRAFADFMDNHYVRPAEEATSGEIEEFLAEYYPRNAWPTERQRDVVERSLEYLFDVAGEEMPGRRSRE